MTPGLTRIHHAAAALSRWLPGDRTGPPELVHLLTALLRKSTQDRILLRASSLAFWTLTAVVPLLLLGFALVGPLGLGEAARDATRTFLYDSVLSDSVEEVGGVLDALLVGTNLRTLGLVGLAGLMATGAGLYFQVELAYNDILGVRIRRGPILRFTVFYAVITLGPLVLAWGLVRAAQLERGMIGNVIGDLLPRLVTALGFVLALRLLPDARVRWGAAAMGGLVTALLFEAAKLGFWAYMDVFGARRTVSLVYGSVAFLPFFMLWLYIVWVVVLFGVEVTYVMGHYARLIVNERAAAADPHADTRRPDERFAVAVMCNLCSRFSAGTGPVEIDELARLCGSEPRHVTAALALLEDGGLVVEDERGDWLPARPPDRITVEDVLHAWRSRAAPTMRGASPEALALTHMELAATVPLDTPISKLAHMLTGNGEAET